MNADALEPSRAGIVSRARVLGGTAASVIVTLLLVVGGASVASATPPTPGAPEPSPEGWIGTIGSSLTREASSPGAHNGQAQMAVYVTGSPQGRASVQSSQFTLVNCAPYSPSVGSIEAQGVVSAVVYAKVESVANGRGVLTLAAYSQERVSGTSHQQGCLQEPSTQATTVPVYPLFTFWHCASYGGIPVPLNVQAVNQTVHCSD